MAAETITSISILPNNNLHSEVFVQKNDQNNLSGILWLGAGNAVFSTAVAAVTFAATAVMTLRVKASPDDKATDFISTIAVLGAVVATTAVFSSAAIKISGDCFKKAFSHLGPEYRIVEKNVIKA